MLVYLFLIQTYSSSKDVWYSAFCVLKIKSASNRLSSKSRSFTQNLCLEEIFTKNTRLRSATLPILNPDEDISIQDPMLNYHKIIQLALEYGFYANELSSTKYRKVIEEK